MTMHLFPWQGNLLCVYGSYQRGYPATETDAAEPAGFMIARIELDDEDVTEDFSKVEFDNLTAALNDMFYGPAE